MGDFFSCLTCMVGRVLDKVLGITVVSGLLGTDSQIVRSAVTLTPGVGSEHPVQHVFQWVSRVWEKDALGVPRGG